MCKEDIKRMQELLDYCTQVEKEAVKLISECRFEEGMELLKKI